MTTNSTSLCRNCKNRFRRVLIPLNPKQYVYDDGAPVFDNEEDNIIISNTCLVGGIDIDGECTVECNHFKQKEEQGKEISLFMHLKK
jgi:hypothetical protein